MSKSRSSKVVVYTSIFGDYDGLLPQPSFPNVEYVCFTDQPFKSKTWKILPSERHFEDPARDSRMRKILAHRFLENYEKSVFIDGNFLVEKDPNELFSSSESALSVYDHNQCEDARDCVYEELEAIVQAGKESGSQKDDEALMRQQIAHYKQEGYPAHHGLITSGVLVRRHHDERVAALMEQWWDELQKGSKRDQLSFDYAAWKQEYPIHYLPGDIRKNAYFRMIGVHRKSYRGKYLRYRLKKMLGMDT